MIRSRKRIAAVAALGALAAAALLPVAAVGDTTPSYFPDGNQLDASAYTLRLAGGTRFDTAGTLARVSAINSGTQGGYPFEEPDRNEAATAYGFATCPKTVGVSAGDNVADALAAAPAKDLAALTVGAASLDMAGAVMLSTQAARDGGDDLSPQVLSTLQDLRSANCTFDAVIFGGLASVSATAEETLDAIAATVVRIAGGDRFDTAAEVAKAVATSAAALPEVRIFEDAETSAERTNAVILAEAFTGADALSAGPFAANKNVPVLLAAGEELSTATRNALLELQPDTILVLGGEAAVPETVVTAATEAAGGAEAVRIAGADRYATSVEVAQQLFGIFPPSVTPIVGSGDDTYSNLAVGLARSEGALREHKGFSDALAAAWFLDTFADKATAPLRVAPAVEANADTEDAEGDTTWTTIGGVASEPKVAPLLLVAQAEAEAASSYLSALYPDDAVIKTATNPEGVNDGGFGFLFGGEGAIGDEVAFSVAQALSGGTYDAATATDLNPSIDAAKVFYTAADFSLGSSTDAGGVDAEGAVSAGDKVCVARGGLVGARWLTLYDDAPAEDALLLAADEVDYQDQAVGEYEPGISRFQCIAAADLGGADVLGLSLSGHSTVVKKLAWTGSTARVIRTTPPGGEDTSVNSVSGDDITAEVDALAGSSTSTHTYSGPIVVSVGGTTFNEARFELQLVFTRTDPSEVPVGDGPDSITFTATLTLDLGTTEIEFDSIKGESATTDSPLRLVGIYDETGQRGGLSATVAGSGTSFTLRNFVLDGNI